MRTIYNTANATFLNKVNSELNEIIDNMVLEKIPAMTILQRISKIPEDITFLDYFFCKLTIVDQLCDQYKIGTHKVYTDFIFKNWLTLSVV